ncbi:cellulose binding domain-containing protein [Paenibacillus donghaensis]|uniref:cellulose binding domain-containing protein n=1 Tax=Paenibacillus donghaensis TaxID=414771 RepID=UPI003182F17B
MLDPIMKPVTFIPVGDPGGPGEGPGPGDPQATLLYHAGETGTAVNSIRASLQLRNESGTSIPLNELTIRYWYTSDGSAAQTLEFDYAVIGKEKLLTEIVPLTTPLAGADTYAEIGFTAGAGSLAASGTTGDIQFRIHNNNWSNYNQADDYSFQPAITSNAANDRITVYYQGKLIYGIEP